MGKPKIPKAFQQTALERRKNRNEAIQGIKDDLHADYVKKERTEKKVEDPIRKPRHPLTNAAEVKFKKQRMRRMPGKRLFRNVAAEIGKISGAMEDKDLDDDALKTLQRSTKQLKSSLEVVRQVVDPLAQLEPLPAEINRRYDEGQRMTLQRHRYAPGAIVERKEISAKEGKYTEARDITARAEVLLTEDSTGVEFSKEELNAMQRTGKPVLVSQKEATTTIAAKAKKFELHLKDYGPYKVDFTKNGRHLLLAGQGGHMSSIDWIPKKLSCEFSANEVLFDAKWLHQETMFAAAQRRWTYIYDNNGVELHCLRSMDQVASLQYLPYHFLLVGGNQVGFLMYLDTSVGQIVSSFPTKLGRLSVMCQNPRNAIIHLGHRNGTVTLWSPNVKNFLAKVSCGPANITSVAVDVTGTYMATAGNDRRVRLWDLRNHFAPLDENSAGFIRLWRPCHHLAFSQKGMLGCSSGDAVQVFNDSVYKRGGASGMNPMPFMSERVSNPISSLAFAPFEDAIGVGHGDGFASFVVPGAGEANYDALEANPFQTKKQRREAEVKMLLNKVPYDMISMEEGAINAVNVKTARECINQRNELPFLRPTLVDFTPRRRKGAKQTAEIRKQIEHKKAINEAIAEQTQINKAVEEKMNDESNDMSSKPTKSGKLSVTLGRFH